MLGLIGTVGGAAALEIRRWRNKGTVEELNAVKKRERELRQALETTTTELERVRLTSTRAQERSEELEAKAQSLEQQAAELSQQREALQQTNCKLVLSNLLLLNKTKQLEEHSRALVAKQEDLQHQLEAVTRERLEAEQGVARGLAALRADVTAVLNKYFARNIDLQTALAEMQGMGIDVLPLEELQRGGGLEFETKLVLDSPHRMQRLMTAGQQLGGGDMPLLSFPLGVRQDPVTGAPRITLAWRTEPHVPGSSGGGGADVPALLPAPGGSDDQQPATVAPSARAGALPAPKDTASADTGKAAAAKATQGRSGSPVKAAQLTAAAGGGGGQALTFSAGSPQKAARQGGGGFLGFGSFGRITSGGGSSSKAASPAATHDAPTPKLAKLPGAGMIKAAAGGDDDLLFAPGGGGRDLVAVPR